MRKYIIRFLEWNARRKLSRQANVSIPPTAEVCYRKLKVPAGNRLTIGEGSIFGASIAFERAGAEVVVGQHSSVGNSQIVCADRVEIGDDVQISWGCTIIDSDLHAISWSKRQNDVKAWHDRLKDWSNVVSKPIRLGNKCWLGTHCIVTKGVTIGEGAIVAAGAVVSRDVPDWTIVAGNPAKIIREIPVEER